MPIDIDRPIALVGLMGVGKTTVGRRLAAKFNLPFHDSDEEIETASRRTVSGYFRDHGEAAFREGERRVIARLLGGKPIILGTGGGAFIYQDTQDILMKHALTIWLKGDFETLFERVQRKDTRPLLQVSDPEGTYRKLMDERYPIYAKAHITVNIAKGPHIRTVNRVARAIEAYLTEESGQKVKKRRNRRRHLRRRRNSSSLNQSPKTTLTKTADKVASPPKAGA